MRYLIKAMPIMANLKKIYGRLNTWIVLRRCEFSNIHWPKVQTPQIKFPAFHFPKVIKLPVLRFPEFIKLRVFHFPRLKLPTLHFPKLKFKNNLDVQHVLAGILVFMCLYLFVAINDGVVASEIPKFGFSNNEKLTLESAEERPDELNDINPAASAEDGRYPIEQNTLDVEAVLIPSDTTVISSSRDSKIKAIYFDNGETFKKGEVLVEYVCEDARAEVEIAKIQQELTQKKSVNSHKLFKLDIISNIEQDELETENKQAVERAKLYQSRMDACFIRAEYDGRVIKRLANTGEFTRTDRVLMEVASLNDLKVEFLLPSRWLRWVNVGAGIDVTINETDKTYAAEIKYIYGEVDPISQSVQITAQLLPYKDPLLPGMSGSAYIDINAIREDNIYGFLEQKPQNSRR